MTAWILCVSAGIHSQDLQHGQHLLHPITCLPHATLNWRCPSPFMPHSFVAIHTHYLNLMAAYFAASLWHTARSKGFWPRPQAERNLVGMVKRSTTTPTTYKDSSVHSTTNVRVLDEKDWITQELQSQKGGTCLTNQNRQQRDAHFDKNFLAKRLLPHRRKRNQWKRICAQLCSKPVLHNAEQARIWNAARFWNTWHVSNDQAFLSGPVFCGNFRPNHRHLTSTSRLLFQSINQLRSPWSFHTNPKAIFSSTRTLNSPNERFWNSWKSARPEGDTTLSRRFRPTLRICNWTDKFHCCIVYCFRKNKCNACRKALLSTCKCAEQFQLTSMEFHITLPRQEHTKAQVMADLWGQTNARSSHRHRCTTLHSSCLSCGHKTMSSIGLPQNPQQNEWKSVKK